MAYHIGDDAAPGSSDRRWSITLNGLFRDISMQRYNRAERVHERAPGGG
jgi:hypothetical protein